ncbi:putative GTPase activating protein [Heterostelium album PN500]|uniref:Putative GTPase activating protein n=1 Tax=Heterostelium pallidum (strain ATCC 26659 / Pp 5 / PN500) TaxID=670386 RepID=D3AXH7_HETP5|nr:putative GTPase activating protein [Heterostelium album PN500]EFA86246.1 putative GTPase activating protein [Heterostelium album PN500]|eukprot:XP_020438351.1 putative GTPase activating protein [Heterostelium album PN500]
MSEQCVTSSSASSSESEQVTTNHNHQQPTVDDQHLKELVTDQQLPDKEEEEVLEEVEVLKEEVEVLEEDDNNKLEKLKIVEDEEKVVDEIKVVDEEKVVEEIKVINEVVDEEKAEEEEEKVVEKQQKQMEESSPVISLRSKTNNLATTLGKCNLDDPIEKSPPPLIHNSHSAPNTTNNSLQCSPTSIAENAPLKSNNNNDNNNNNNDIPLFSVTPSTPPSTSPTPTSPSPSPLKTSKSNENDTHPPMLPISLSRSAPNLSMLLSESQRQNLNNRVISSNLNSNNNNNNNNNNAGVLDPLKQHQLQQQQQQQNEQKQMLEAVQLQMKQQEEKKSSLRDALRESVPPITLGNVTGELKNEHESNGAGPLVGGVRPSRVGAVFDHFIVVGLPSTIDIKCSAHDERQKHQPQILYTYPEGQSLPNDMIVDFCFPNGIESRSSQRSSSYSSLNQIAFCNLSHLLNPDHSFVFLLNTASTLYYGVCIVKEEEVSTLPTFMPEPKIVKTSEANPTERKKLNRDQYDFIAPRVYCLLTRFPFFQLHFQVLHSVLERERMLMLFAMTQSQDPTNVATMDIINMYYNINMETIREKIQFKIPGQDLKTDFHCPNGNEDRLIADWSLFTAFESINLEDIVTIFAYALMERSILVLSKNLGNCSAFIYSFIPLLKPFTWQCCFIPILPESLIESLDAPFPFLIGIKEIPADILSMKKDYLIMEEKSKEFLMEYQRLASKRESKVNVDMNIIKQQLKDSEGVISELRESKKKLEMEALAVSPSKSNGTLTSFLGLSEIRKKKLEFGHRRSRSVSDQVEKNILKKSVKGPSLSFFDFSGSNSNNNSSGNLKSNLSRSQSPLSISHNPIMEMLEKEDQQQQQQHQQSLHPNNNNNNSNSNSNSGDESSQDGNSPRNLLLI